MFPVAGSLRPQAPPRALVLSQYSGQTRLAHTSLQMPYEGANEYLKVVNDYDKQPTWLDRWGF